MRTSTLLFFGAFLAMFAIDFMFNYLPSAAFEAEGTEHPFVQNVLKDLSNPIDATSSPIVERHFSVGYIMRASVAPGIRLIHDPSLAKEIIVKGPTAALDVLNFEAKEGRLSPDFTKTVKLKELVEIRVNLEAHGSKHMRVNLFQSVLSTALTAEFTTTGPLNFRLLELINAGNSRIEVDVENLVIWSHNPTENIFGTAERLEILNSDNTGDSTTLPNLKASEIIRTKVKNIGDQASSNSSSKEGVDSLMIDIISPTNRTDIQ